MIAARDLDPSNPSDLVLIGGSWYGVAEHTSDDRYVLSHECPDGSVLTREADPWDEFWTAGERLAELRGELDDAKVHLSGAMARTRRPGRSHLRWEMDAAACIEWRRKRDAVQAQIDELVLMGVVECVMLGPERCATCRGSSYERAGDPCPVCSGSAVSDG